MAIIVLPMAVGYILRRRAMRAGRTLGPGWQAWSRRLKLMVLGVLVPPVAVSAMIRQPLTGVNVLTMAVLGVACLLVGAMLGRLYIALRKMPSEQAGAVLGCASMANLASFGGLVVFAFWGNIGLQQLYLFKLLEHVLYYAVFYPWCSTYSPKLQSGRTGVIASFRQQPVTLAPIIAVFVGLACNYALYQRAEPAVGPPQWTQDLNDFLVPFHVGLLTFAVGLTLKPSRVRRYLPQCAVVATIKVVARPLAVAAMAYVCMRAGWIDGFAMRVAIVLAAMPVAFNSLIAATVYDLDEDLANSCWIVTTALMVVVVPVLFVLLA